MCVLSARNDKNPLTWPFRALKTHTTVYRINTVTVVSKATKFSSINIVADLIWRETQKPFYTESGTIDTATHDGLLYIFKLLHPWEYSGIYFIEDIGIFQCKNVNRNSKINFYFTKWTPNAVFSQVAVFMSEKKIRSYTESIKFSVAFMLLLTIIIWLLL